MKTKEKPKKTENLSFRLSADNKETLDEMADDIGCAPSALACKATEVWIEACRKAGGHIKPQYRSDDIKDPLKGALSMAFDKWNESHTPEGLEIEASPDGQRITIHRKPYEEGGEPALKAAETTSKPYQAGEITAQDVINAAEQQAGNTETKKAG